MLEFYLAAHCVGCRRPRWGYAQSKAITAVLKTLKLLLNSSQQTALNVGILLRSSLCWLQLTVFDLCSKGGHHSRVKNTQRAAE